MPIFPNPSGPYSVGCSDIVSKLGEDRCLFRIFYPAFEAEKSEKALWLPSREYAYGSKFFECFNSKARIHAVMNADLDKRVDRMPVVVFSHGLQTSRTHYNQVCIELASKGMFAASVEHGDKSANATYYLQEDMNDKGEFKKIWIPFLRLKDEDPTLPEIRNRQLHQRAEECKTVLQHIEEMNNGTFFGVGNEINFNQFQGKIDVNKAAVAGHGFGGASAVAALADGTRFKVGIALDADLAHLDQQHYRDGVPLPCLFINTQQNCYLADNFTHMKSLISDALGIKAERKVVTIKDSNLLTQTDFPLLTKWTCFTRFCQLHGPVDPVHLTGVGNDLVGGFIGKHLGLDFGAELDDVVKKHEKHILVGFDEKVNDDKMKCMKKEQLHPTLMV